MGIQRWGKDGVDYRLIKSDEGHFVMFADHEQVVADLRAELAAKSKDAERYRWLRDHAPEEWDVTRWLDNETQEIHVQDYLDEAIDSAMGEGNGR